LKAVVLAAGRGSRLGSITANKPKCMTELLGKTLLAWELDALRAGGADDVCVVTGYCAEAFDVAGVTTAHNAEWASTNMVRSLLAAEPFVAGHRFLVSYSDIAYSEDTVRRLAASNVDVAVVYDRDWLRLWATRSANPLDDAETFRADADQSVLEIGGRSTDVSAIAGQYIGLLHFSPVGFHWVRELLTTLPEAEARTLQMTHLLARLIARGHRVVGVPIDGGWVEVDTEEDLRLYRTALDGRPAGIWHHDWRAQNTAGGVVWITGLSGAGKSTVAREVIAELRKRGTACVLLDGDEIRRAIDDQSLAHDPASRLRNAWRLCRLAALYEAQGLIVVAATMSLFNAVHTWNRAHLSRYFEVLLDVPLHALARRDPRGLYARAARGEVSDVVGVHLPFDLPLEAHLVIDNSAEGTPPREHALRIVAAFLNASE
jgi:L-glutamine-phosphate cytidylyltransferase